MITIWSWVSRSSSSSAARRDRERRRSRTRSRTRIPCPAICRDEIKEGVVHAEGEYTPAPGDALSYRTLDTFFGVVRFLVEAGVTIIAEGSFQHGLWEPGLQPLLDRARVRIVRCRVDAATARERVARRADKIAARRAVHGDYSLLAPFEEFQASFDSFEPITLPVPSIEINTTDGYDPTVEEIVAFMSSGSRTTEAG